MTERVDTVVVGAGQAGLALSAELCARGREHVVLERGRIGESWRTQRWDSFRLVTPAWMSGLPGAPLPCSRDGFASLDAFVGSLEHYAVQRSLPVRAGVGVVAVTQDGDGFRVRTTQGTLAAARLAVAAGGQNRPLVVRAFAEALDPRIAQLHVADYRSPDRLPPGGVLVVGGAQSGAQVTAELVASGRRVLFATSPVRRAPRRYRGRDMLSWWDAMGWFAQRPEDLDPAQVRARLPMLSGVGGGTTLSLHQLARDGVVVLGRLAAADGSRVALAGDRVANVRAGDAGAEGFRTAVEQWLAGDGRDEQAPPPEPDPVETPCPALLHEPGPSSVDLLREGVGSVIWCTGFGPALEWLGQVDGALHRDGGPRHRRG
ncbi:MAG TPA: NAD(P)/FAD-dependent oxidoreductase, partial [Solirubrobacteraceae bacterium]|nr:NAD(P)/FAD-dependent oxidoreductase [Solirubrobacteraceae bacterium]